MRNLALLLAIFLVGGCSSKPLDREQAQKNMQSQAGEVRQAMLKEDHRKMAELSHPMLVENLGGTDQFVKKLTTMAAEMKGQGFRFVEIKLGEPSKLVEASGDLYGVIPFTLLMTGPGGKKGTTPSYLIAVSTDGGRTWKFLDGSGIASDPSKLKVILPNFPKELELPAPRQPTWE